MAKTRNRRMSAAELGQLADEYRDLALQIKDLEAKAKPIKEDIVAECRERGVEDSLDLGSLLVVRQDRASQSIDQQAVTPDWLYRFQSRGGRLAVKVDLAPGQADELAGLLVEVGFEQKTATCYLLKLKAQ